MKNDKIPVKEYVKQEVSPLNLLLFVADRCNFTCPYCYNRMPRHQNNADLDLFYKYVADIHKKLPTRELNVSLIGGEPTLHPNLLDFCDKLQKLDRVCIEVLTNFTKPLEYYINLLKNNIKIAASWHRAPNDMLNWDYVEKMKKIPYKYFTNDQVEVRIMMENDNWENSRKVFNELYPPFKKYVEISLLSNNNGSPYRYTDKQLEEYRQLIILTKYKRDFFTVVYNDGSESQVSFSDMYLNPQVNFHLWKCNAGLDYLYVHVNGDVYNCQSYYEHNKKPICNIVDTNGEYIKELYKPCICAVDYCSCDFDVTKERILNVH